MVMTRTPSARPSASQVVTSSDIVIEYFPGSLQTDKDHTA